MVTVIVFNSESTQPAPLFHVYWKLYVPGPATTGSKYIKPASFAPIEAAGALDAQPAVPAGEYGPKRVQPAPEASFPLP